MDRRGYLAMGITAIWLQWTSCSVAEVDLEGKRCPCAAGWVCDPETDLCVVDRAAGGSGGADRERGELRGMSRLPVKVGGAPPLQTTPPKA